MSERTQVTYGPPAKVKFEMEMITDTAGCKQSGGSGASGWGYNQSNIIRCGEEVYAMSWRDDLTLTVFRRVGPGQWEASLPLPPVPQNGNLLVDSTGHLHVIAGKQASYHVVFDPPGQVKRFTMEQYATAESRFGASINAKDQIFVAGGLANMTWYVLNPKDGFRPMASGVLQHEKHRGYNMVIFNGAEVHSVNSDDYFIKGDQYPNQSVTTRDPQTGELRTVETPRGIYPVLNAYYYYCPDIFKSPDDWRMTVTSDVSDTFDGTARGTTDHQDIMLDAQGLVHLTYYENRQPSTTVWAGKGQDQMNSSVYHAVGKPGGPFTHFCVGKAFNSCRVTQTPDGRFHYLLTRGGRGNAEGVWYATGEAGQWDRVSEPIRLEIPSRLWHFFVNMTRSGGTRAPVIDCYWTGAYSQNSNEAWYGRLTPEG
ncbi:MAG: hypothetical protein EXS64_07765 [Candidatus Latescibacteria bacterium]|nr:hypothetical protein [Candidatus Latescibacterota bacterium]